MSYRMKSGGMYDAIMKYMEGGSLESSNQQGRVYKFGGKTYPHGGVHNPPARMPDIKFMAKDSYKTAEVPRPGTDFFYLVDGQPTDFDNFDVINLLKSEGISGDNLGIEMRRILGDVTKTDRMPEDERAFREKQMAKIMEDVRTISEAERTDRSPGRLETGAGNKTNLGALMKYVRTGAPAQVGLIPDGDKLRGLATEETRTIQNLTDKQGKYTPGRKANPNVDADAFLRALGNSFNR